LPVLGAQAERLAVAGRGLGRHRAGLDQDQQGGEQPRNLQPMPELPRYGSMPWPAPWPVGGPSQGGAVRAGSRTPQGVGRIGWRGGVRHNLRANGSCLGPV
jgi:hypothetical protein